MEISLEELVLAQAGVTAYEGGRHWLCGRETLEKNYAQLFFEPGYKVVAVGAGNRKHYVAESVDDIAAVADQNFGLTHVLSVREDLIDAFADRVAFHPVPVPIPVQTAA
jgi:hypothetical protein